MEFVKTVPAHRREILQFCGPLAAAGGLESYIFVPYDLEQGKILGTLIYGTNLVGIKGSYDEVNPLCSEIAENYGWAL